MKRKLLLILLLISSFVKAQEITDTIEVSYTKSVYLIFSSTPEVEKGSNGIFVKTSGNKVSIQSDLPSGFKETNLFVQCGSQFYMFIVKYTETPSKFIYNYQVRSSIKPQIKKAIETHTDLPSVEREDNFVSGYDTEIAKTNVSVQTEPIEIENTKSELIDYSVQNKIDLEKKEKFDFDDKHRVNSMWVIEKNQNIHDKGYIKNKISFIATNLYVNDDYFYFKLYVDNKSKINYDIDFIRFTIQNKKKSIKKETEQYIELHPIYIFNEDIKNVRGKESAYFVYVLDKFTIENHKKLNIEMWEKHGDRKLKFDFFIKDILNIKTIND